MTFSYNPGGGPDEFPNSREAPPSDLTLAYEEIRTLRTEVARLREALEWALTYIEDGMVDEENPIPPHYCEFQHNPEAGYCDFHDKYVDARNALSPVPSAPQTPEGA